MNIHAPSLTFIGGEFLQNPSRKAKRRALGAIAAASLALVTGCGVGALQPDSDGSNKSFERPPQPPVATGVAIPGENPNEKSPEPSPTNNEGIYERRPLAPVDAIPLRFDASTNPDEVALKVVDALQKYTTDGLDRAVMKDTSGTVEEIQTTCQQKLDTNIPKLTTSLFDTERAGSEEIVDWLKNVRANNTWYSCAQLIRPSQRDADGTLKDNLNIFHGNFAVDPSIKPTVQWHDGLALINFKMKYSEDYTDNLDDGLIAQARANNTLPIKVEQYRHMQFVVRIVNGTPLIKNAYQSDTPIKDS